MNLIEQLRDLTQLPGLVRDLAEHCRRVVNRPPPPAFVMALLQAQTLDNVPVSLGASTELHSGVAELVFSPFRGIKNITVMVFADMRRVRIEGITVGQNVVGISNPLGSPIGYHPEVCAASSHVRVSVSLRQ